MTVDIPAEQATEVAELRRRLLALPAGIRTSLLRDPALVASPARAPRKSSRKNELDHRDEIIRAESAVLWPDASIKVRAESLARLMATPPPVGTRLGDALAKILAVSRPLQARQLQNILAGFRGS